MNAREGNAREGLVGASSRTVLRAPVLALIAMLAAAGCTLEPAGDLRTDHGAVALVNGNNVTFNALGGNGVMVNGIHLNGLSFNGIHLNGIHLNGIHLNGIHLNGIHLNGIHLNGIHLNGIHLNGLSFNGIHLNGIHLNGIHLNGIHLNGIHLNGLQMQDFKRLLRYLTECSLESGDCITAYDADGTPLTYCGVEGIDPGWGTGLPDLTKAGEIGQCVLERGTAAGDDVAFSPVNVEAFKSVLVYLVECALEEGDRIDVFDENEERIRYRGALGLAPEWKNGPLSSQGELLVSACLAARGNALHRPVQISLRGAGLSTAPAERDLYDTHEGAFWANLFTEEPYINACLVSGGGLSGRVCAETGTCGFNILGSCASICDTRDPKDLAYSGCYGSSAVINTFLNLGSQTAFGTEHSCIRKADGTLWCWGKNGWGQLGIGSISGSEDAPAKLVALGNHVVEVAAGERHTCARKSDGIMWCWGDNQDGQIGSGARTKYYTLPYMVEDVDPHVASMGIGKRHTCAHKTDGTLWCWGSNNQGQIGDGSTLTRRRPVQVTALGERVAGVSSGASAESTCAIDNDGALWCWGNNDHGQLGDGTKTRRRTPVAVTVDEECDDSERFDEVTDVCTGEAHTCARKADGTVWCWGQDTFSQLGDGNSMESKRRPVQVDLPVEAVPHRLSCGARHTCVVDTIGRVWCWGKNSDGQLGDGTNVNRGRPVRVKGLRAPVTMLTAASRHTCASLSDASLWCWGEDEPDALFPGQRSNVPRQVVEW